MTEQRPAHTTREGGKSAVCPTCGRTVLPPATSCLVCDALPEHAATGATRRLHPLPLRVPVTTWRGWVAVAALVGAAIAFVRQAPGEIRSADDPRILIWLGALAVVLGATALARRRALELTPTELIEHRRLRADRVPTERIAGMNVRTSTVQYGSSRSLVIWDHADQPLFELPMDYYRERDLARLIETLCIHHPEIVIERELRQLLRLPAYADKLRVSEGLPQP